jgi:hypothetical protein
MDLFKYMKINNKNDRLDAPEATARAALALAGERSNGVN